MRRPVSSRDALSSRVETALEGCKIERCEHEAYVSNTRKVAYIHAGDDRDDLGDAYKLAELVHFKPRLLHAIQHRSREAQIDLSWIRAREVLVESRTQLVNAVRGISKAFGASRWDAPVKQNL
jgi:hypothetical protein